MLIAPKWIVFSARHIVLAKRRKRKRSRELLVKRLLQFIRMKIYEETGKLLFSADKKPTHHYVIDIKLEPERD